MLYQLELQAHKNRDHRFYFSTIKVNVENFTPRIESVSILKLDEVQEKFLRPSNYGDNYLQSSLPVTIPGYAANLNTNGRSAKNMDPLTQTERNLNCPTLIIRDGSSPGTLYYLFFKRR